MNHWFGINEGLAAAGRFPALARVRERISAYEILLLILCGSAAAAASGLIRLGLRLPGHSILLSMIPMILGLALAPRRLSGFIMSASAFSTGVALNLAGLAHIGSGAFISLCLIGPVMDLAVSRLRSGWKLYFGLVLAGICTNLMALSSRGLSQAFGAGSPAQGLSELVDSGDYYLPLMAGALAGLVGALAVFSSCASSDPSPKSADAGLPK